MTGGFEIPTIVFLLLAVLVIARLVNVLGRKTGQERPYDRYRNQPGSTGPAADNVIPMPRATGDVRPVSPAVADSDKSAEERMKGQAQPGSALERGYVDIARQDPLFDPKAFLKGAKTAYELIVLAFAEGDRKQLKALTAKDVFDGFARAIGEREGRGETNETNFIGIHKADVIDADAKDQTARMTVKFISQLITVIRNKSGEIIEGDAKQVRDVTDIWTFARDAQSKDPNWKLVATQSAN